MRALTVLLLAAELCGCATTQADPPRGCRPTGWIDRVEGLWVVIDPDDEDAETLVLPTSCFSEPVHGGLRIVDGHIDLAATAAMKREMEEIAARLVTVQDD
jgi:hypothetical protein